MSLAITELCQLVHAVNACSNTVQIVLSLRICSRTRENMREGHGERLQRGSNTAPTEDQRETPRHVCETVASHTDEPRSKRNTTICSSTCGLFQRAMGRKSSMSSHLSIPRKHIFFAVVEILQTSFARTLWCGTAFVVLFFDLS